MIAVLKREIKAYFYSPLGYVFISAYFLFTGFFFYRYTLMSNTTDLSEMFTILFTVTLFLVPILTMRLMSEDRKNKTDQLLLMSPISSYSIIFGKFLAAVIVFLIAISGTIFVSVVLSFYATPEWPVIIGNFVGLFLLGMTLISVGLLISSLTENQIIAAVGGFSVSFFMMLLNTISAGIKNKPLAQLVSGMSLELRYNPFTLGILSFDNVIFFITISGFFVFLTSCLFEKRRWC